MHQYILPLKQIADHVVGSLNDQKHVIVPLRLGEVHVKSGIFSEGSLEGFVVGIPNSVDVGDVEELHLAIRVKLLGLVPLACYFIAECCHFVAGVEDDTIRGTLRLIYMR